MGYLIYLFFKYGPIAISFTALFILIVASALDAVIEIDNAVDCVVGKVPESFRDKNKVLGNGTIHCPYRYWTSGTEVHRGEWWFMTHGDNKILWRAKKDGVPSGELDFEYWSALPEVCQVDNEVLN